MTKHTPKEFWILDNPERPYPVCYRGEPTWGGEPDDTGRVVRVVEATPLVAAAPDLLDALKGVLAVADRKTKEFDAARAAIAFAEGRNND